MRFALSLVIAATLYVSIISWASARSEPEIEPVVVARARITPLPMHLPEMPAQVPLIPELFPAREDPSDPMRVRPTEAPDREASEAPTPTAMPEVDEASTAQAPDAEERDAPVDEPTDSTADDVPALDAADDRDLAGEEPAEEDTDDQDTDDEDTDDEDTAVDNTTEDSDDDDSAGEDPSEGDPARDEAAGESADESAEPPDRAAESAEAYADLPDDLKQLPDLVIETGEKTDWDQIDAKLGIQTLAYTVDAEEPTTYLTWAAGGKAVGSEEVDLRPFSNRCRDRNNIGHFRRRLTRAKRDLGIQRPMRVVGLVPNEIDRQFAATQLAAIRASGLEPAEVRSTVARYSVDEAGVAGIVIQEIKPFARQRGDRNARQTN